MMSYEHLMFEEWSDAILSVYYVLYSLIRYTFYKLPN